jgi:hypothetical protein
VEYTHALHVHEGWVRDLLQVARGHLARAIANLTRRNAMTFPGLGQEQAFDGQFAVPHDGLHVLSGYSTSIQGELLVSTFTGAMHRRDALRAHILPVIFEWHVGHEVNGIGAQTGALDPATFLTSRRRRRRGDPGHRPGGPRRRVSAGDPGYTKTTCAPSAISMKSEALITPSTPGCRSASMIFIMS